MKDFQDFDYARIAKQEVTKHIKRFNRAAKIHHSATCHYELEMIRAQLINYRDATGKTHPKHEFYFKNARDLIHESLYGSNHDVISFNDITSNNPPEEEDEITWEGTEGAWWL